MVVCALPVSANAVRDNSTSFFIIWFDFGYKYIFYALPTVWAVRVRAHVCRRHCCQQRGAGASAYSPLRSLVWLRMLGLGSRLLGLGFRV